jgi:flagella basal body P-ring formation protein FlgA
MIRFALTFAVLAALGCEASAETPAARPKLKELVTVTSEVVRIGDLVEDAGDAADTPVFRAPDLGQTGSVQVARIAEAMRPHGLERLDTGGLSEVVVTRLSRAITGDEIKERIARAVAGQFGFGEADKLAVILDRQLRALHVEANVTADLAIARMNVEPRTGRFDVGFDLPGSMAARRFSLRFTGTVTELAPAVALTRSLRAGEVIKTSDLVTERRPKLEVGPDAVGSEQAVGLAAKAALRSGQVLRQGDLVRAQVVQRNEAVTIVYEVPGVTLTVRGKAVEAGAVGDVVSVLNVQTNRTIQGTVIGPGRIAIGPPKPQVTAAAVPAAEDNSAQHTE